MGRHSERVRPAGTMTQDRALAIAIAALGGEPVVDVMEELDAPPEPVILDNLDETILQLQRQGLTDRQIEAHPSVPIGRAAIRKRRERLGLEANYTVKPKPKREPRTREWWDRQDRTIHDMIVDGYSDGETAETLGISASYVTKSRLRQGLQRNYRQAAIQHQFRGAASFEANDTLWTMWKNGANDATIAAELGLREAAVRIRRNKLGLPAHRAPWRPMSPESIKLGQDIEALHKLGHTDRQIAEKLGRPVPGIADKRYRMGLPVNSARPIRLP